MNTLNLIKQQLAELAAPQGSQQAQRFFKTGAGQYAEGDIFLGVSMPALRKVAAQHKNLSTEDIENLLHSQIHEHRALALVLWVNGHARRDAIQQQHVFNRYLQNTAYINNWDLVDISAPTLVGDYLLDKPREILYQLVHSAELWERRIAVVATLALIRKQQFSDTLNLAAQLLNEPHDLIHKAVGWMLREVGKHDKACLETFLQQYCTQLPRTSLRYAIEHFSPAERQFYLQKPR